MTTGRRPRGLSAVAQHAGVSVSLASRVLNGDSTLRVRDETRERVVAAARELHYVPHGAARALRLSRAGAIGLVVHDVSNPIHAGIIRGAQEAAAAAGQVLLLAEAPELAANNAVLDQLLGDGRIDGLLWQGSGFDFDDALSTRAAERLPTLLVNSRPRAGLPALRLADEDAAGVAVDHLVALGHRDIGYLGGRAGSDLSDRRQSGWRTALQRHGLPVRRKWIVEQDWNSEAGHAAMSKLLSGTQRPTAVFVANVVVSVGALAAAREAGVRVPEDLSVIGLHDAWFVAHGFPPLTTVRLPLQAMGRRAVELVLSGAKTEPGGHLLSDPPPELVVRRSTASPG
jgi:DNA-binding LacI/PurR family transcriptional regulator